MKSLSNIKERRLLWILPGLLLLGIVCFAVAIKIVNSIDYHNNDFFTFWLAGQMVTHAGDPYSPMQWVAGHRAFGVTWIPNQAYVYPLPLSLLFVPFGLLSLYHAYIVWVALSILMILAALALLLKTQANSGYAFIPMIIGGALFRPTILTLFNGQISGWLLLLLAITVFLWEKGKWEWGSLLLPLLMLKPNLGAPLVVILGFWLLLQKRFKSILVMLLMGLFLLVIGFLQDPHWLSAYWNIGNAKLAETFGGSPTVWGLGYLFCRAASPCLPIFGGCSALLLILVLGWLVTRISNRQPFTVVALAVAVTLLITPYTWTYDQLLLIIPITAVILAMNRMGVRLPLTVAVFLGIDLLFLVVLIFDTLQQVEIWNVVIPMAVFGLCLWWLPRRVSANA